MTIFKKDLYTGKKEFITEMDYKCLGITGDNVFQIECFAAGELLEFNGYEFGAAS